MRGYAWIVWRAILASLLVVVAFRATHLALYNWWAAGGPPSSDPVAYARLGNTFFGLASLSLATSATLVIDLIKDWIKLGNRSSGSGHGAGRDQ